MNVLALDLSAPRASMALRRFGRLAAEREWDAVSRDNRAVFRRLQDLLADAGLGLDGIDLFVAGRGPGNYSGLRAALTVAAMLAAPSGRPTVALDSGLAVAEEVFARLPVDEAIVAGDARRGWVWCGRFRRMDDGSAELVGDWRLCRPAELDALVPPGGVGVSPEWTRLAVPAGLSADGGRWRAGDAPVPARHLARRAEERWRAGRPFPPSVPLYLHPPVAGA